VLRALETAPPGPSLIYDLGVVARRMALAREAAREAGVELLYAVKAFPVPDAIALAVEQLDGLDVAGPEEQQQALALAPTAVSVTWPGDVDAARIAALAGRHRVTVVCETAAQVAAASAIGGVTVAVRLLSDEDSRFGIAPDALRAVAGDRVRALHVHGGPLLTAPARVAERARLAVEAAGAAGIALEQLDLGGSLHGFAVERPTSGQSQLGEAFAAARAAVPAHVRVVFEPGRLWTEGAGFAAGRVLAARDQGARLLRVLELSRLAHLRWCSPRLVAPPPRAGDPRHHIALLGASCCEDDQIGDALVPTSFLPALAVGERVVLGGITGYAAAWNRGFAGVPAAHLLTV
jgi:diaminopimelate decarboxylase